MKRIFITFVLLAGLLHYGRCEIDLQNIEIPDIDDITFIKERCDKKGGEGTYENIKTARIQFQDCMKGIIDFSVLKTEVEESKKTGSMDEVFGKYCAKRPKVKECVLNFTNTVETCLEDTEKQTLNLTLDILKQLGEFVCYRDGDRIAMFVAEGGVECIKDHTEGIKTCVNSTLKINPSFSPNSIPNLIIDKKKCNDLTSLQNCVVEELEKCKDSTPANIVDALFRFIKRSACQSNKSKRSLYNSKYTFDSFHSFISKEKCLRSGSNESYEDILDSAKKTAQCYRQKLNGNKISSIQKNEVKKYVKECSEDLFKQVQSCLLPAERGFPQFYLDLVNSILDFVYANQEIFQTSSFNKEVVECFGTLKHPKNRNLLGKCMEGEFPDGENLILNKENLCAKLTNMKSCLSTHIGQLCRNDIVISKLRNDFFEALANPCKDINI